MNRDIIILVLILLVAFIVVIPSSIYIIITDLRHESISDDPLPSLHAIELHLRFSPFSEGEYSFIFPILLYQGEPDLDLIKEIEKQQYGSGLAKSTKGFGLGIQAKKAINIDLRMNIDRPVFEYSLSMQNSNSSYYFFSFFSGFMQYKIDIYYGALNMTYSFMDNLYDEWSYIEQG
jgi:hypothetical protein